ncbi:MAG: hypothetical protein J6X63_05055 [Bacteroidales bacterium]|nr:hypothetical protein [Bacteroidales bacterium]
MKKSRSDVAARYNKDPRLAFVEVGFGHWGEYHTYGTTVQHGVNFPTKEYQHELFSQLSAEMEIPWLISIDAGEDTYTDVFKNSGTKGLVFGLFDDSFMHKEHDISQGDGWNERCWQWCGMERWKTGVTWEQAAAKYHMSFVICNDAPSGSYFTSKRVTEAGLASGYRFKVISCETDGSVSRVKVTNTGVAPIYRDAYVTIGGVRASESLKGLLPGVEKTYEIKAVAATGNVSITSDFILSSQEIEFEI